MKTRRNFVATAIAAIASITVASAQANGNAIGVATFNSLGGPPPPVVPASPATVANISQQPKENSEDSRMKDKAEDPRITRARLSGPEQVTKNATVAEIGAAGVLTILLKGTNEWVCVPGDENKIGAPPMCMNPMGMRWMLDAMQGKAAPTNTAPGAIYMLCGATQRSNTDPLDRTSPALPIGPHWMITWPFDAEAFGLPTTMRDKGAWMMFAGTPYAYLHVCGTPWDGNEYHPEDKAVWTMSYERPRS